MASEKDKKGKTKKDTPPFPGANLTPAQLKAAEGLSVIYGRLFLTVICGLLFIVTVIALLLKPTAWSKGLAAFFGSTMVLCFRFYFSKKR